LTYLSPILPALRLLRVFHGQAKPVAYVIAEIGVTNPDAYMKEFVPLGAAPASIAHVAMYRAGIEADDTCAAIARTSSAR
jgi:hypothetical protein